MQEGNSSNEQGIEAAGDHRTDKVSPPFSTTITPRARGGTGTMRLLVFGMVIGLAIGIAGTILGPQLAGPYLPPAMKSGKIVVVAMRARMVAAQASQMLTMNHEKIDR